jgi:hypothetical protein
MNRKANIHGYTPYIYTPHDTDGQRKACSVRTSFKNEEDYTIKAKTAQILNCTGKGPLEINRILTFEHECVHQMVSSSIVESLRY